MLKILNLFQEMRQSYSRLRKGIVLFRNKYRVCDYEMKNNDSYLIPREFVSRTEETLSLEVEENGFVSNVIGIDRVLFTTLGVYRKVGRYTG